MILRNNIDGITKPVCIPSSPSTLSVPLKTLSFQAIRRLARRGGVKRISGLLHEETRGALRIFLDNVPAVTCSKIVSLTNSPTGHSRLGFVYRARKEVGLVARVSESGIHLESGKPLPHWTSFMPSSVLGAPSTASAFKCFFILLQLVAMTRLE
jgi:hypothetical protein